MLMASVVPTRTYSTCSVKSNTSTNDLHNHCRHGDVSLLESYLHDTVTPSVNQRAGTTGLAPIHEAAIAGHPDVIRLLKKELDEIDVNIRTDEGPASTPLHLAAQKDNAETVIALVECGAVLNAVDRCWRTPLDVAMEHGSYNVVHVISMFEMCKAAESENVPLLDKLLLKVTSYQLLPESLLQWNQSQLNAALLSASKRGNRHIVSKLVSYGANNFRECIDSTHQNNHISAFLCLCQAVLDEDTQVIDILLAQNEESVERLERYNELMIRRVILNPLLQNGKVTLTVPIKVALAAGKLEMAGRLLQHVSRHPSSGVIDWHDLDLSYIDPHWLQGHGINSLTYIGLSFNKLRVLPEQIVRFNNLQKIQIHHNHIACLPSDLFTLPRIAHIDVSFNSLVTLPPVLRQRISSTLETLNLANNKLETLPDYLVHSRITLLDISFNWFSELPECIFHMKHLHTLNLNNNIGLEVIPYPLGNLKHLAFLGLEGLPYLKNMPSKDKTPPIGFLRTRARTLHVWNHYDVAVVGTEEPYHPCLEKLYTSIEGHSKRKHFSCLKFSNTKQFLHFQQSMSLPSTVYVIVWDCQSEQPADELLYHIHHLSLYAPKAIIIVAACWIVPVTPTQEHWVEEQLKRSSWKQFRNLISIATITIDSNAVVDRNYNLQSLLDLIDRKGSTIHTKLIVPDSYNVLVDYVSREAKRLLEDNKPPLISSWDMWELVRSSPQHDLASHKELSLVLSFLISTSTILSLHSNRPDERDYHVLHRQWFLDTMTGLLVRRQNLSIPSALYPLANLCDLLNSFSLFCELPYALYTYASQVSLAIPVTSHNALISTMLPSHNTNSLADFSDQYQVRRVYTFLSTPTSLWPQLIAHLLISMSAIITSVSRDSAGEPIEGCHSPLPDTLPRDLANWSYWNQGIVVWLYGSQLVYAIEAIKPIKSPEYCEGLQILVNSSPMGLRALNIITVTINSLLKCWYPQLWKTVQLKALCPYDENHTLFPLQDCCHMLLNKTLSIRCEHDERPLNVSDLIPDLSNHDLTFVSINDLDVDIHEKSTCLNRPPRETVFRGDFNETPIALKPFPPPNDNNSEKTTPFLNYWYELSLLNYIRQGNQSPYLMELFMSTIDPLALIFRCATYSSLEEVILESSIVLLPLLRVRMIYQLASALETLHSQKVIHRNVSLENIMVYSLSLDDHVNIKLGGFSSSCLEIRHTSKGERGSFPAPEMSCHGYEYDQRVDVFSFAFAAYEILTRKKLKCRRGVKFQTASGHYERPDLKTLSKVSPYFTPLLEKCWTPEPNKRPFFIKIVEHFQSPIHNLVREGMCVNENHEYNAAAVRYMRENDGTFSCHLYICSSILSMKDSTVLSHLSIPGLNVENTTSLPSQCIICMACTSDYLWVSFQFQFVRVYSAKTLEFVKEIQFDCHILVMAVSPSSIYLGKEDGEIQVYNLLQPSPLHSPNKTQVIHYQQPIKALQVLDDSIICCTKQSFARLHPVTLKTIQQFPTISESPVKCAAMAVDRKHDMEYLWVGFRRLQQLVVFDGMSGKAMYGINCCEVLYKERHEVWVNCMQVVLDTVWVGLNTGHILSFSAYSTIPLLLTYFKPHIENVRSLLLLQPSYWGHNSRFPDENESLSEDEELTNSYSLHTHTSCDDNMPRVASVLSCGQGIRNMLPKVGTDGVVLASRTEDINGLQVIKFDGPDCAGARKLECQAHRPLRPYMESYNYSEQFLDSMHQSLDDDSFPSTLGHRSVPHTNNEEPSLLDTQPIEDSLNPSHDPELSDYICVTYDDVPPHITPTNSNGIHTPTTPKKGHTPKSPIKGHTPNSPIKGHTPNSPIRGHTPNSPIKGHTPNSPIRGHTPNSPIRGHTPNSPIRGHTPNSPIRGHTPSTPPGNHTPKSPTKEAHLTTPEIRSKSFSFGSSTMSLSDSDDEGGGYVPMRSASVLQSTSPRRKPRVPTPKNISLYRAAAIMENVRSLSESPKSDHSNSLEPIPSIPASSLGPENGK